MRSQIYEIDQIINPAKFQIIQDDIASATDLAIITVDYKGKPITKHSKCTEFCNIIRSSQYGVYCESCDSHGGLEAARLRKPYIYTCHAGLIDFAIPILANNLYLGAFMAGQVLLSPLDSDREPEQILHGVKSNINMYQHKLKDAYTFLPTMRLEKIHNLANMLLHIGNYCIKDAELNTLLSQHTDRLKNKEIYFTSNHLMADNYEKLGAIHQSFKKRTDKIIEPALVYIKENPKAKITLDRMASICNISPSYFSKLFAKENLGSLSDYSNNVKIGYAKELLLTTNWTILTVAESVGFNDCGYFIKIFKKFTHQTPLEYREKPLT